MPIKPLKKFGQNYLTDKNVVDKMLECLQIQSSDSVLEIGSGKGFISKEIYKKIENFCAIEIDTRVIDELKFQFPKAEIINSDFTKINFHELKIKPPVKIIGNIPFNLTGDILFKLLDEKEIVKEACFIIPLDIAKRLTAKKRTKEYGALTIIFNYFSSINIVSKVSKNVFYPKPNVETAIIHIIFDKTELTGIDKNIFIKVVKAAFGNRRKTLNNSLRNSIFANYNFSSNNFPMEKRAEELEVKDYLTLTEFVQKENANRK
ncbi:MAG: ribosomal RNA small subunit methyltransferase A [Ignavibacteriae bacterium]|nr:ribosomal RNA small subunit methyltransferase A [Ignavibacteriota bacterium]